MVDSQEWKELQQAVSPKNLHFFTGFHSFRNTYLEPQFNLDHPFTEKMIRKSFFHSPLEINAMKTVLKVALITGASAGFGMFMGLLMSSFEYNQMQAIDHNRSSRSQLKQHFYGYGRFMKK